MVGPRGPHAFRNPAPGNASRVSNVIATPSSIDEPVQGIIDPASMLIGACKMYNIILGVLASPVHGEVVGKPLSEHGRKHFRPRPLASAERK